MDPQSAQRIAKLDEVLRQVPYQYQNKARLRQDVAGLLQSCRTLQPQTNSFSGGGRTVTLFYLYGVVPITYQGSTYNIPVTIYFDPPYPKQPPRCFVTPTAGMALKQNHQSVDSGGMVYSPFLSSWSETSSTLPQLVKSLAESFSSSPPVYSTTTVARPTSAQQATQPQPAQQSGAGGFLGFLGLGGQQPASQPAAAQPAAVVTAVPVSQAQPVATVVATPVPARPRRDEREDLVKAVTSSLKERWPAVVEPLGEQLKEQQMRQTELQDAKKKLDEEEQKLKDSVQEVSAQKAQLETMESELRSFLEAETGQEMDPDKALASLDPDRRQVLDRLAEELSLEELLTAMDELLAEGKISVDDFMREVREAGRRQFMCKMEREKAAKAVKTAAGLISEEPPKAPELPVAVARPLPPGAPVQAAAVPARQLVAA